MGAEVSQLSSDHDDETSSSKHNTRTDWASTQFSDVLDTAFSSQMIHSALLHPTDAYSVSPTAAEVEGNEEVGEIHDAAVILAPTDTNTDALEMAARLIRELKAKCGQQEAFEVFILQRLTMFKCIHEALSRREKDVALAVMKSGMYVVSQSSAKNLTDYTIPYDVSLGIHMFFSLLNELQIQSCDYHQRLGFLDQVIPVLSRLEPLSLENITDTTADMFSKDESSSMPEIVDSLRSFLYQMATTPPQTPPLDSSLDFFKRQNKSSVTALIELASARGRASDLLLVVSVLLGVGITNVNDIESETENIASDNNTPFDTTTMADEVSLGLLVSVNTPAQVPRNPLKKSSFITTSPPTATSTTSSPSPALTPSSALSSSATPRKGKQPFRNPMEIAKNNSKISSSKMSIDEDYLLAEEMDSNTRKKLEARKRMSKPDDSSVFDNSEEKSMNSSSSINLLVLPNEEERRRLKKIEMLKKAKMLASERDESSPTEELWLPSISSKSNPNKQSKQLPLSISNTNKNALQLPSSPSPSTSLPFSSSNHDADDFDADIDIYDDDDDLESSLESISQTRLKSVAPAKPHLLSLEVRPFLSQLSLAKVRDFAPLDAPRHRQNAREVWTCGQNSYGELAHGDTNPRKSHNQVLWLEDKEIINVAAGNEHTAVLTRDGKVYTAGYNDNGQCGQGHQQRVGQLTVVDQFPVGLKAVQVHAYNGCEHTMVIMEDGRLFSFGYNYRGQLGHGSTVSELVPRPVRGLEGKCVSLVSCSYYHTVVTCESDEVFSFGRNDFGQLGHGDTTDKKFPQSVEALKGKRIVSLGCGQYHTVVATKEGVVFACGKNDHGQLGIDPGDSSSKKRQSKNDYGGSEASDSHKRMTQVKGALENEHISEVRCGYYHTIALTSRRRVYGFGRNDYGQLGLGQINSQRVQGAHIIEAVEGKGIVRIAAGCYHSVFAAQNGMIYVCGRNNHGQLGTGDSSERHLPHPIDTFSGKSVSMIAAGFYHTIILTGGNEDNNLSEEKSENSPFSAQKILALPFLSWNSRERASTSILSSPRTPSATTKVVGSCASKNDALPSIPDPHNRNNEFDDDDETPHHNHAPHARQQHNQNKSICSSYSQNNNNEQELTHEFPSSPSHNTNANQQNQQSHPEDNNEVCSLTSTDALPNPFDDANSEVTLNRVANLHGNSLWEEDGTVRQDKTAIFILAHMERLASSQVLLVGSYPVLGLSASEFRHAQTIDDMGEGATINCNYGVGSEETNERYCVDVSPTTFQLLLKLIAGVHDDGNNSDNSSFPRKSSVTATLLLEEHRSYLIISCLRILKANLSRLLTSKHLAGPIRAALTASIDKSSDAALPNSVEIDEQGNVENDTLMPQYLLNEDGVRIIPPLSVSTDPSMTFEATVDQFKETLSGIHYVLISIIESPSFSFDAASIVQAEAARALIMGVELFYPSQQSQIQVLADLFACPMSCEPSGVDVDLSASAVLDQMSAIDEESQQHREPLTGLAATRYFMLDLLLKRLSDDALVCYLIPNPANFSVKLSWPAAGGEARPSLPIATTPSQPSVSNLNSLLKLLVKQIITATDERPTPLQSLIRNVNREDGSGRGYNNASSFDHDAPANSPNSSIQRQQILIVKLILSIQKHAMHWAAGEQLVSDSLDLGNQNRPSETLSWDRRAMLERSLTETLQTEGLAGSTTLLEYTTLVMLHSIEYLTDLVKSLGRHGGDATLQLEDVHRIELGVVGTILPSVVIGLLPFARRPLFAKRLLPLATKLVHRLDSLFVRCPYLVQPQQTSTNSRPDKRGSGIDSVLESEGGISDTRTTASSSSSVSSSPPRLLWMMSLVKSSTLLASALAETLIFGRTTPKTNTTSSSTNDTLVGMKNLDEITSVLACKLLENGLDASIQPSLVRHGLISQTSSIPSIFPQSKGAFTSHHAGEVFLDDICSRKGEGAKFTDFVRSRYSKKDMGYKIISKQSASATQAFESLFFAASLKHEGLVEFARKCAHGGATNLPTSLFVIWRVVAEATKWLWSRRSQLKSEGNESRINGLFASSCSSLSLLMLVSPAIECLPLPMAANPPLRCSRGRDRFRRAIQFVVCLVRWRRVTADATAISSKPVQEVYVLAGPQTRSIFSYVQRLNEKDKKIAQGAATPFFSHEILSHLLDSYRKASSRISGLWGFNRLFCSMNMKDVRNIVLSEFTHAIKGIGADEGASSYSLYNDLAAVGQSARDAVKKSVEQIYLQFLVALEKFSRMSDYGEKGGGSGSSKGASIVDTRYLLLLLDVWGINFHSAGFLATSGVIDALQMLLRGFLSPEEASASDAKNNLSISPTPAKSKLNRSSMLISGKEKENQEDQEASLKQCKDATWVLLRLLVIQACGSDSINTTFSGYVRGSDDAESRRQMVLDDVLFNELCHSVATLVVKTSNTDGTTDVSKSGDVSFSSVSKGGGFGAGASSSNTNTNAHRRRCQELIGAPKRFTSTEDGMKFPPDQLLHNTKSSDFSIAFWLHLTQDSTGKHRSLIVRGHKHERWPAILLRPLDRRIDVGYSSTSPVLSSNSSIQLSKWTHVSLVSENNKLKLYINGACDCQRSNTGHLNSPRSSKHALYVGRVPEGSVKLDGVRGGFEGSIAFLRFYSRALSPIHVRIVCDQGPPAAVLVKDRKCFQICSCLHLISRNERGLATLSSQKWMGILLFMFINGTTRVQQAVIRLWKMLLVKVEPNLMSNLKLNGRVETETQLDFKNADSPLLIDSKRHNFANYLLRIVGLAVWRNDVALAGGIVSSEEMTLGKSFVEFQAFLSTVPSSIASCCVQLDRSIDDPGASSPSALLGDAGNSNFNQALSSDVLRDIALLSSEVISLIQTMVKLPLWEKIVSSTMRSALEQLANENAGAASESKTSNALAVAEGFAVLSVLGGHIEELRPGIVVDLTHTDVRATVVHFEESSSLAHVVMHRDAQTSASNRESKIAPREMIASGASFLNNVIKMSSEDLYIEQSSLKSIKGWSSAQHIKLIEGTILPLAIEFLRCENKKDDDAAEERAMDDGGGGGGGGDGGGVPIILNGLMATIERENAKSKEGEESSFEADEENETEIETNEEGRSYGAANSGTTPCVNESNADSVYLSSRFDNEDVPEFARGGDPKSDEFEDANNARDPHQHSANPRSSIMQSVMICQARSRFSKMLYSLSIDSEWVSTLCNWPDLIKVVAALAVQADGNPTLSSLEETEARVWFMRKRLFQILSRTGSVKVEETMRREAEKNSQASRAVPSSVAEIDAGRQRQSGEEEASTIGICPFCGVDNSDEAGLAEHVLDAHLNDERCEAVACPICVSRTGDESLHDLPTHMDIHHIDASAHERLDRNGSRSGRNSGLLPYNEPTIAGSIEEVEVSAADDDEEVEHTLRIPDFANDVDLSAPAPDVSAANLIGQLMVMGFREEWCTLALRENNNDVEFASTWIVDNLDFLGSLGSREEILALSSMRSAEDNVDGESNEDDDNEHELDEGENDDEDELLLRQAGDLEEAEESEENDDMFGEDEDEDEDVIVGEERLHLIDNLETEGARIVFEENYFTSDPGASGFDTRAPSGYYGGNANEGGGFRTKGLEAEIAAMELDTLLVSYSQAEKLLALLHARATLLQLLQSWPEAVVFDSCSDSSSSSSSGSTIDALFGGKETFVQVLKVTCFRGSQFSILPAGSASTATTNENILPTSSVVLRPFILSMLRQDEKKSFESSSHVSSFASTLLDSCLDDLEAAASIDAFDDMSWGSRVLSASDSQALLQPNVELAHWIVDLMLTVKSGCVYKRETFQRLSTCLLSANMPIKDVCMHLLWRIVVGWFERLESLQPGEQRQQKQKPRGGFGVIDEIPGIRVEGSSKKRPESRVDSARYQLIIKLIMQGFNYDDILAASILHNDDYDLCITHLENMPYIPPAKISDKHKELSNALVELVSGGGGDDCNDLLLAYSVCDNDVERARVYLREGGGARELMQMRGNDYNANNIKLRSSKKEIERRKSSPLFNTAEQQDEEDDVNSFPREQEMVQLLFDCIPLGRLKRIASQRAAEERRHERIFLSKYTQRMTQLVIAVDDLLGFVKGRAEASAAAAAIAAADAGEIEEVCEEDEEEEVLPNVEELQMNVISENAICVSWSKSNMNNNTDDVDVADLSSSSSNHPHKYDVEMATRTSLDVTAPLSFTNIYSGHDEECVVENLLPSRPYFCRARVVSQTGRFGPWCPFATSVSSPGVAFTFDRLNSGPSIFVSPDGLGASFGSNEAWSTVMASTPFITGVNYWEISVDKSQTAYLFIGVATKHADTSTFLGGDDFGWGYIGDRALYHKRAKAKAYGERFGQGDVIGVSLDLDAGTLSFSRNGEAMGVAFDGLAGELYPAVAFYNQGQRVSLVREGFRCPDAGMVVSGSPGNCDLEDVEVLSRIMGSMCNRIDMDDALLTSVYKHYSDWSSGQCIRYMTRCGFELLFDCSAEAVGRLGFGLKAQDIVQCSRGSAKVIGVSNGMLWVHVEGESGAWFFKESEVVKGREFGEFFSAEAEADVGGDEDEVGGGGGEDEEGEIVVVDNEEIASASPSSPNQPPSNSNSTPIPLSQFAKHTSSSLWTASMDALIITSVNAFSERFEVSPWNLSLDLLTRACLPARRQLNAHYNNSVSRTATDTDTDTEISDVAIACRYAVLMVFNAVLVNTFSFVGSGEGLQLSSKLPPCASIWGLPEKEKGLAVGVGPKDLSFIGEGPGLGLAPMLTALRNSIFYATKKRIVSGLLERTVTQAKRADDEYDYPPELPQVLLNRPKAFAGKTRKNMVTRISLSLFGQLYDELHFLDPSLLRLGYTHPMDDGQERTFKVKFEGEGVDDYGGPYREIFGQLAGELQALESDVGYVQGGGRGRGGLIGGGVKCILPLLCPTKNWRGGEVGNNDSEGVEGGTEGEGGGEVRTEQVGLYLPNPTLTSHIYLEMFNFVGQLIGITLRSRITTKFRFPPIVWKALVGERAEVEDLRMYDEVAFGIIGVVSTLVEEVKRGNGDANTSGSVSDLDAAMTNFDNAAGDLTFTATLSDGTVIDLIKDGSTTKVSSANCAFYLKLFTNARLHESDRALFAMRDGLVSVVPSLVLPLLTWSELELLVCGKDGVDIDLLQANTEYDDDISVDSPHIQSFWRVLRSFDNEDRSKLLKFVWARERLPNTSLEFHQHFKIQSSIGDGPLLDPDAYLPKAHTCFFSLNLPKYSCDEVMRVKLLYAIYNCVEMDADFKLGDSENGAWGDAGLMGFVEI